MVRHQATTTSGLLNRSERKLIRLTRTNIVPRQRTNIIQRHKTNTILLRRISLGTSLVLCRSREMNRIHSRSTTHMTMERVDKSFDPI